MSAAPTLAEDQLSPNQSLILLAPLPASCLSIADAPGQALTSNDLSHLAASIGAHTTEQLVALLLEYTSMAVDVTGIVVEYVPHLWALSLINLGERGLEPFDSSFRLVLDRILNHGWCLRQVTNRRVSCKQHRTHFVYGPQDPSHLQLNADLTGSPGFITQPDGLSGNRSTFIRLNNGELIQRVSFLYSDWSRLGLITSSGRKTMIGWSMRPVNHELLSFEIQAPEGAALVAIQSLNTNDHVDVIGCIFASINRPAQLE